MLRPAASLATKVAIVLGSGLNELADRIIDARSIPYDQVPHFPRTTVAGHEGKVLFGKLGGVDVVDVPGPISLLRGARPRNGHIPQFAFFRNWACRT